MKNIIIVCGHCNTTLKAAKILAKKIGGADIFNTLENQNFDFTNYDNFIFGSNIRMFMLNSRFKKYARKLKKYYMNKNTYGYLIGCKEINDKALEKMSKKLHNNKKVVYAWGEFVTQCDKPSISKMYTDMRNECINKGETLPFIREEELDKIANLIVK